MSPQIEVHPLSRRTRKNTFRFLLLIFVVAIPFLYMYATGYRLDISRTGNIVSTGGMYIAVEQTGAEIYIDDELVRETRTFRKAFYAQGLLVGTHKVHVQKDGYHTWVKELPVSKHLVTEAEALNLPIVPQVRIIAPWQTATGTQVLPDTYTLLSASTTNATATTEVTSPISLARLYSENEEHTQLLARFMEDEDISDDTSAAQQIRDLLLGSTTTPEEATTTVMHGNVRLYEKEDGLFVTWVGPFEDMPYYYCAPDFPPYSASSTASTTQAKGLLSAAVHGAEAEELVIHPVQSVTEDVGCEPTIQMAEGWTDIRDFTFLPDSEDFVLLVTDDGVHVMEVDNRAWQNSQVLIHGDDLELYVESGNIYVYDGTIVYQVFLNIEE